MGTATRRRHQFLTTPPFPRFYALRHISASELFFDDFRVIVLEDAAGYDMTGLNPDFLEPRAVLDPHAVQMFRGGQV